MTKFLRERFLFMPLACIALIGFAFASSGSPVDAAPAGKAAGPVQTAVDVSGYPDGVYLMTLKGGAASVRPFRLITPDGETPTDPTNPPGPVQTPFEKTITAFTKTALTNGGSKTTGAALSEVYSRVSAGVVSGSIKPENSLSAVFAATNAVMADASVTDDASWADWRLNVGDGLDKLKQEGELSTAAQYASALKQVSTGLNVATGYNPGLQTAVASGEAGQGILDGIDIDKIIKLIELIMKLLTLFGGIGG